MAACAEDALDAALAKLDAAMKNLTSYTCDYTSSSSYSYQPGQKQSQSSTSKVTFLVDGENLLYHSTSDTTETTVQDENETTTKSTQLMVCDGESNWLQSTEGEEVSVSRMDPMSRGSMKPSYAFASTKIPRAAHRARSSARAAA